MIMKIKNIAVIASLILGLAACKNENDNSLVGKWQEVKLRAYYKSYSGVISNDTTYTGASLDTTDYALFSAGGTCVLSNHHVYPTTANIAGGIINVVTKEGYTYTPVGSKYILTVQTTLIPPSGFITTDTLSRSGNTILIHSVIDNHQDYTVSDAYYTR
jgi:hypothetical protein